MAHEVHIQSTPSITRIVRRQIGLQLNSILDPKVFSMEIVLYYRPRTHVQKVNKKHNDEPREGIIVSLLKCDYCTIIS